MKPKEISRICTELGVKEFPPTDPRYSEPRSAAFLSSCRAGPQAALTQSTLGADVPAAMIERYNTLCKDFVARFGRQPSGSALFSLRLSGVIPLMESSLIDGLMDDRLKGEEHCFECVEPADAVADHFQAEDPDRCPYCGEDACPHLALRMDMTFREILGGTLHASCKQFLERVNLEPEHVEAVAGRGRDALTHLEELLEGFEDLFFADAETDGVPGQSSAIRSYWVEDPSRLPSLVGRIDAMLR